MRIVWSIIGLSICLLLLGGCSPSGETAVQEKEQAIPVRIVHVTQETLPWVVESVGRLAPQREVTLSAEVSGVVAAYHADVGDRVKAGQVLVALDATDYRLALQEAEANHEMAVSRLNLAKKMYERAQTLLPRKVITPDDFDKVEAEYISAGAAMSRVKVLVDVAKERLDKTRIRSSFDGLVEARLIEIGQMLGSGQPVMTVADLNSMRLKIHLAEKDYVHLDPQDVVAITLEAFPEKAVKGRIDRIGIKADDRTNTFAVEILLQNPDVVLKAGMTARTRITIRVEPNAVLIPQSTVQYKRDRQEVFVVGSGQRAEPRAVTLGRSVDGRIQILSGLTPGDQLIVSGGQYLRPGDSVLITAFGQAGEK